MQCVASWIFLYFACLSPIITFGGLLSDATGKNMAAMESLVSGFVCGIGYGLFSGQPLTILGSTGPVLVFEQIIYDFSTYVTISKTIKACEAENSFFEPSFEIFPEICLITQ